MFLILNFVQSFKAGLSNQLKVLDIMYVIVMRELADLMLS